MKVFIFEHVCGGGIDARDELPPALVAPGGAMLAAAVADFVAGGFDVITTLDERAKLLLAPEAEVCRVGGGMIPFEQLSASADAALVIAPECDGILPAWLGRLRTKSLGCSIESCVLCGDKLALAKHLRAKGIPTPVTALFRDVAEHSLPCVVKPIDGAGCEDTIVCRTAAQFAGINRGEQLIVQPYVQGMAVSCSVLVRDGRVTPLLPGEQTITGDTVLGYAGGRMPLRGGLGDRARDLACRAAGAVPGLAGYVGVDMVLGEEPAGDCVIEINPRLSVSFVALRRLCLTNLARAIVDPAAPLRWSDESVVYDAGERGLV